MSALPPTAPSAPPAASPARRRRLTIGIAGCLGATLVLAALVGWAVLSLSKHLSEPRGRPRPAALRLPPSADQQQAVQVARQGVTAWDHKDYAALYRSLSRRAAARSQRTEAQFAQDMAKQRKDRFFEEDTGQPSGFAVLQGAWLDAIRARLQQAANPPTQQAIAKSEWPRPKEAEVVPVEYELGGFAWAAIMVKEDGAWRAFVTPGECARDELRPPAPSPTDTSGVPEAKRG